MNTQRPAVEILMATYNGEAYLREQIDSILAQREQDWHMTVSDDGSTDGTPAILDAYARQYPEKITRYISGKRFGNARDHFFHLMAQCEAPYMLFCDQDDVWYPQKLGRTLDALRKIAEQRGEDVPALAFCDQRPTDGALRPIADSLMRYQNQYAETIDYRSILMQNVVTGGAMGINRAAARLAAQCADPSGTIMHDWWLAAAVARFGEVRYIDEVLGDYRQHGTNSVGAKDVRSIGYTVAMFQKLDTLCRGIAHKKRQAAVFMDTYAGQLNGEDLAFLKSFIQKKSGPLFYWKYRVQIHGFFRRAGMMILG